MKKIFLSGLSFALFFLPFNLQAANETDAPTAPPRDQGYNQTLIMILIALVFFYFILWRPEQKRRKTQEDLRTSLKKGDRVTAMGILGTITKVQEHTVILRMVDGAKIEVLKGAINEIVPSTEEDQKKLDKDEEK